MSIITRSVVVLAACLVGMVGLSARPATLSVTSGNGEYRVVDYGATCNGVADDTLAIQAALVAAFPGGTVVLPDRRCVISQPLEFRDPSGAQSTAFISMRGTNPITSQLAWRGPTNVAAIKLIRNKYFTLERFGLLNMAVGRGTSIGILLGGYGTAGGTETLEGDIRMVVVQGFGVNIQAGDSGSAASEIRYDHVTLTGANICWQNENANTLNHVFTMLSTGDCGVGVKQNVGNLAVRGGSTYSNGMDFQVWGTTTDIEGMRAELPVGGVFVRAEIAGAVRVAGNITKGDAGLSTRSVSIWIARSMTISDNWFGAPVVLDMYVGGGALALTNNRVRGTATAPVIYTRQVGGAGYRFVANWDWVTGLSYPDASGFRDDH